MTYFARQVIEYIFGNCCAETDVGEIEIKDGEEILEKLGYSDFYNDIWEKVNESART